MRKYQVMSGDGHIETPIDWQSRVAAKYKDKVPKLIMRDDGAEAWVMDEWSRTNMGNLYCGLRYDEFTPKTGRNYHDRDGKLRPGTGSPAQRLREQDEDGIDAELLYHAIYGPTLIRNMIPKDKGAYLAMIQAYNTHLAEEYCSVAPDRLIGCALVPETGVEDAIKEMERCKKMGLIAASLTMWPSGGLDPVPAEDDRFWAAVLDMDMKMAPHVTFGGPINQTGVNIETAISGSGMSGGVGVGTIARLTLHVFDKFPKLKFYFAETQAGWLAYTLNWIDEFYMRWYTFLDIKLKKLPSEYYRHNCLFGFVHDRMAMEFRDYIGTDLMVWGTDFPHSQGTYPDSKEILKELFEGVPEVDQRKVLVTNLCDFLGLDANKPITPTP